MKDVEILDGFSGWTMTIKSDQLELRKRFKNDCLIILNDGAGYDYKQYLKSPNHSSVLSTRGFNIHFGLNGPLQMTFEDWNEINTIIQRYRDSKLS